MVGLFERFDRLDTALNRWLVANSIALLRVSLGLVFVAFGALKFFPGLSPIEGLATRTTGALTFGVIPPDAGLAMIAALEVAIGLCFVAGRFLRVGVWSMKSTLFAGTPRLASAPVLGTASLRGRDVAATPVLTGLEIEDRSTESSRVGGTAHFRSEDGYEPESGEEGSVRRYRQKLTLEPGESGWKVTEIGTIVEER